MVRIFLVVSDKTKQNKTKRVLAQTPAVQEANVAEHVTMSPEQDEEVDPISDQIQQLQLLQQHQQLQQLKQQQKQLPSPCDSKLNSLQAAIRSLQQQVGRYPNLLQIPAFHRFQFTEFQLKHLHFTDGCEIQLNQIQLLAQNVQHSPAPPTLEYIEVSPAVFMLAAKAHADGETKGMGDTGCELLSKALNASTFIHGTCNAANLYQKGPCVGHSCVKLQSNFAKSRRRVTVNQLNLNARAASASTRSASKKRA